MIDSFTPTVELAQGQDRGVKATFSIKLNGYIITDTYNRDKANLKKFYSKSQVTFGFETVGDIETLTARAATPEAQAPARFFDGQTGLASTSSTSGTGGMTAPEIAFLTLNTAAIANSITTNTATFTGRTIAMTPPGFTITEESFLVYVNGILIPPTQRTTAQVSGDIVVTFNTALIKYVMKPEFEILLVGKYS
jgi:hypothetical protein